jgi:hypothetical protein
MYLKIFTGTVQYRTPGGSRTNRLAAVSVTASVDAFAQ